jgi:hypothetical protein
MEKERRDLKMEDAYETCEEEGRRSDRREKEREEGEKENKTIKKYYLKKMKSEIKIIVRVFFKKLIVKCRY